MATKYVDNVNGSDAFSGDSPAQAYARINTGITNAGVNGIVHVIDSGSSYNGGDNAGTLPIQASADGQTIQGYDPGGGSPQHVPTLSGTNPNDESASVLDTNQHNNVTFSHFSIPVGGISIAGGPSGAGGCIIEYITASRGSGGSGRANPCTIAMDSNNVNLAPNNIVRYCTLTGPPFPSGGASNSENHRTIFVDHQNNATVHNCTLLSGATGPAGIGIKHVTNGLTVHHCFFQGFTDYGFQITTDTGTTSNIDLHNNVFACPSATTKGGINPGSAPGSTISNWGFYNNTIYAPDVFNADTVTFPTGTWRCYNNILYLSTSGPQFYLDYDTLALSSFTSDFISDYNMCWRSSAPDSTYFRQNSSTVNLVSWRTVNWPSAGNPDANSSVSTNPNLSNVGGTDPTDYRSTDSAGTGVYDFGRVGGTGSTHTYAGAYSSPTADDVGNITASSSSSNVTAAAARTLYVLRRSQGFRRR